jgi:hypothetical protein
MIVWQGTPYPLIAPDAPVRFAKGQRMTHSLTRVGGVLDLSGTEVFLCGVGSSDKEVLGVWSTISGVRAVRIRHDGTVAGSPFGTVLDFPQPGYRNAVLFTNDHWLVSTVNGLRVLDDEGQLLESVPQSNNSNAVVATGTAVRWFYTSFDSSGVLRVGSRSVSFP